MIFLSATAAILAMQLGSTQLGLMELDSMQLGSKSPELQSVQYYRVRPFPPPCGDGFDISARDGLCYPNGYLPPQDQLARQGQYYGGRRPVPCGNGADIDTRDGQCYPTGTVPRRFQQGWQYDRDYGYQRRPPRRYYDGD